MLDDCSQEIITTRAISLDETPVWSDIVSETAVDTTVRKKTVTLKTSGHEKSRVSVCLAAKADGPKLKPMIVLIKGAKREAAVLRQEFKSKAYIASSSDAWMTTELTNEWVGNVLGSFAFDRRQLSWVSYECHDYKRSRSAAVVCMYAVYYLIITFSIPFM